MAQKRFLQTKEVLELEATLRPKVQAKPPDYKFVITSVLKFKCSILSQLMLGLRSSVPSSEELWDLIQPMSVQVKETLAFSLTADVDADNKLVQPDKLKVFQNVLTDTAT